MLPDIKHKQTYIYQQYRPISFIQAYRDAIDDFIQDNYYDYINYYISSISLKGSHPILYQFVRDYYGVRPLPFGEPTSVNKYDENKQYDTDLIYDDTEDYNGYIEEKYMLKFAKFVLDYSKPVFNLDVWVGFLADFCETTKDNIGISFDNKNYIFTLPNNEASGVFLQMIKSNSALPGMPHISPSPLYKLKA